MTSDTAPYRHSTPRTQGQAGPTYRPEIDGLRAVAVLPVMLFHAGIAWIPGGYAGVDVFFVISGFLITSIIMADVDAGRYSLTQFYERRARRILPALFLLLVLTTIVASVLLPRGTTLEEFGDSVVATTLFYSNVLFWQQSGYFETAAELKPLLHTWSLSVEEQFYVLYPPLLVLLLRRTLAVRALAIAAILLVSLALSQWASSRFATANYFLLPTRMWELLAGAMAAQYVARFGMRPSELMSASAVLLVAGSFLLLDPHTPFPGVWAIPVVAGTAMLLVTGTSTTLAGRMLGARPLVSIGLISYSAYLYHQPFFAFYRVHSDGDSRALPYVLMIIATLAIAYASWRWVEAPVRKLAVTRKRLFLGTAAVGAIIAACGLLVSTKGPVLPEGYIGEQIARSSMRNGCDFYSNKALKPDCVTPSPERANLLLWGDSHAGALSAGIRRALGQEYNLLQITTSGCTPSLSTHDAHALPDYPVAAESRTFGPACEHSNATATQLLRGGRIDTVSIAMRKEHEAAYGRELTQFLARHVKRSVVLVGPVPQYRESLPAVAAASHVSAHALLERHLLAVDERLQRTLPRAGKVTYLSLIDEVCDRRKGECMVEVPGAPPEDRFFLFDYGHLSRSGSIYVGKFLTQRVQQQR